MRFPANVQQCQPVLLSHIQIDKTPAGQPPGSCISLQAWELAVWKLAPRAEFKSIYRGIVDGNRKYRGFTPDEAKAIKAVAQGNFTTNMLRRIASLSGGSGPQRAMQNLLQGGAVGGGIGFALGGPAGAAIGAGVAPVAGQVAGRMATRGTQRRANLARAMAARGETPKQARRGGGDTPLADLMVDYMESMR